MYLTALHKANTVCYSTNLCVDYRHTICLRVCLIVLIFFLYCLWNCLSLNIIQLMVQQMIVFEIENWIIISNYASSIQNDYTTHHIFIWFDKFIQILLHRSGRMKYLLLFRSSGFASSKYINWFGISALMNRCERWVYELSEQNRFEYTVQCEIPIRLIVGRRSNVKDYGKKGNTSRLPNLYIIFTIASTWIKSTYYMSSTFEPTHIVLVWIIKRRHISNSCLLCSHNGTNQLNISEDIIYLNSMC